MAYKKGANRLDQNRIAKLVEAGASVEKISDKLLIDKEVVKGFVAALKKSKKEDDKK